MPAARTPKAKAEVTGTASRNPLRHRSRPDPQTRSLGEAPDFLDEFGRQSWEGFKRELPWLMESDRAAMEVCAQVRGLVISGAEVGVTKLSMYQVMLSKLGATPSDRSRISASNDETEDEFFDN